MIFKYEIFRSCFFQNRTSKFIWFFLPILLMLLINSAMFVFVVFNILQNQKYK